MPCTSVTPLPSALLRPLQVGAGVSTLAVGDSVYGTAPGSLAEYVAVDASRIAKKPATLSFAQAASMPTAYLTGLQSLRAAGLSAALGDLHRASLTAALTSVLGGHGVAAIPHNQNSGFHNGFAATFVLCALLHWTIDELTKTERESWLVLSQPPFGPPKLRAFHTLAEPPQKKQSGRSNDWGDEEQSVFLSPRRRGCQAAQQPGAAGAAGMASVQYDNSACYLLVLALLSRRRSREMIKLDGTRSGQLGGRRAGCERARVRVLLTHKPVFVRCVAMRCNLYMYMHVCIHTS